MGTGGGDRGRSVHYGRGVGSVVARNRVSTSGLPSGRPMLFVHGFGCDQSMWRLVAPRFEADHRVVLVDLVGSWQ